MSGVGFRVPGIPAQPLKPIHLPEHWMRREMTPQILRSRLRIFDRPFPRRKKRRYRIGQRIESRDRPQMLGRPIHPARNRRRANLLLALLPLVFGLDMRRRVERTLHQPHQRIVRHRQMLDIFQNRPPLRRRLPSGLILGHTLDGIQNSSSTSREQRQRRFPFPIRNHFATQKAGSASKNAFGGLLIFGFTANKISSAETMMSEVSFLYRSNDSPNVSRLFQCAGASISLNDSIGLTTR